MFRNGPSIQGEEQKIKRYVHSPLKVDHNGITAEIKENGRIVLSNENDDSVPGTAYDKIEIPASLVFKLASLLKATRKVKWMNLSELKSNPGSTAEDEA